MLSEHPDFQKILSHHQKQKSHSIPRIIRLVCNDSLKGELSLIERLISEVSAQKQRNWVSRLINTHNEEHYGAWFEIRLYDWLKQVGNVSVEPNIEDCFPDFSVSIGDQTIVIEAKVCFPKKSEIDHDKKSNEIRLNLREIHLPFWVSYEIRTIGEPINKTQFRSEITQWLTQDNRDHYSYTDGKGNVIALRRLQRDDEIQHVHTGSSKDLPTDNHLQIRKRLKKKAKQHRAIRIKNYPYIIAVFIEPYHYSVRDVVNAWFGNPVVRIDTIQGKITGRSTDHTGLHHHNQQIDHTSVSGTLVFQSTYKESEKMNLLEAWVIDNPYAKVRLNSDLFPVSDKFIVETFDSEAYYLNWVSQMKDVE